MQCRNDLSDCTCEDIEERLVGLKNSPHFIYKMCRICEKHYALCKCDSPDYTTSCNGVEMKDVENKPTLKDMIKGE